MTEYIVYDFMADWCGPCQVQTPILEELDEENDNIEVIEIDVDVQKDLANQYEVTSIPTTILFDTDEDGEADNLLSRWIGVTQKDTILEAVPE